MFTRHPGNLDRRLVCSARSLGFNVNEQVVEEIQSVHGGESFGLWLVVHQMLFGVRGSNDW